MQEKIKISSSHSEFLSGSSKYNITLEIINLTGKPLYELRVKSIAVPGKLLSIQGDPSYGERYKGDIYYEAILNEIQLQIFKAYKILEENEKRELEKKQRIEREAERRNDFLTKREREIQDREAAVRKREEILAKEENSRQRDDEIKLEEENLNPLDTEHSDKARADEFFKKKSIESQILEPEKEFISQYLERANSTIDKLNETLVKPSKKETLNSLYEILKNAFMHLQNAWIIAGISGSYTPFGDLRELLTSKLQKEPKDTWPEHMWQAMQIRTWKDLENLEEIFISPLTESNEFLKRAFYLNKSKLRDILDEKSLNDPEKLSRLAVLKPGQIISFTFYCKSPNLYSQQKIDAEFEIIFLEKEFPDERTEDKIEDEIIGRRVFRETLGFRASSFSVSLGTFLGSIFGFFVKEVFLDASDLISVVFWRNSFSELFGAVLLAFILTVATRRSEEGRKFLTVEDFSGGFFVGSLAGLFSEQILDFLRTLLPGGTS